MLSVVDFDCLHLLLVVVCLLLLLALSPPNATALNVASSPHEHRHQQPRHHRRRRTASGAATDDVLVVKQQIARNLLSVCAHVQNPELYSATDWADSSSLNSRMLLAATKDVCRGQILSLYPIHAIGCPGDDIDDDDDDETFIIVYDVNNQQDKDYFGNKKNKKKNASSLRSRRRLNRRIHLDLMPPTELQSKLLGTFGGDRFFIDVNPNRDGHNVAAPGWLGHLAVTATSSKKPSNNKNCIDNINCRVIPLAHAVPFCCLVATQNITKGQILFCCDEDEYVSKTDMENQLSDDDDLTELILKQYKSEIDELASYVQMSYQPIIKQLQQQQQEASKDTDNQQQEGNHPPSSSFQHPFHTINMSYRGLKQIHTDPDIFVVPDFLSNDECDRLISKASQNLQPCLAKNEITGIVEQDPSRTSTNANIPRREVPGVVQRILNLLIGCEDDDDDDDDGCNNNNADVDRLEILQTLRYQEGQRFYPHTDGFDGPISACGFRNSGRIATLFCYLNDLPARSGGGTKFNLLGNLTIQPQKGMSVVHFPNTLGLEEDTRTEHEGLPILGSEYEKWLLVTWLWRDPLSDERYGEQNLPSLSSDII